MSEAIIGAVITAIISGAVSLVGIIVSAHATTNKVTQKLDANQQVMNNEIVHIKENMTEMKEDIKNHNHYAQLFNENIPVIKEKLKEDNRRLTALEHITND